MTTPSTSPDVPSRGLAGLIDWLFGPGAAPRELRIQLGLASTLALSLVGPALWSGGRWTLAQSVLAAFMALDIAGGIVTAAAPRASRWHHRPDMTPAGHFRFVAVHLVYVGVVWFAFRSMDMQFLVLVSSYLLASTALILACPLDLRRPIAYGLFALSIPLNAYALGSAPGLEWFVPLLSFKLLVGYLVPEQTADEKGSG